MSYDIYYATPKQIQDLAIERHLNNMSYISFPEGVASLMREGKLTPKKPEPVPFRSNMTVHQFDEYILSIPLKTKKIAQHATTFYSDLSVEETELFPYPNDIFCFKHLPYMNHVYHTHDYFEITLTYKGNCLLLFENKSVSLTEGDLCIIPPGSPHNQPTEGESLIIGIAVRRSTFDKVFSGLLTKKNLVSTFFRDSLFGSKKSNYLKMKTDLTPRICNIVQQLTFESNQNDDYANSCAVSLLNVFFNLILRNYSDSITFYSNDLYSEKEFDFALILQYIQLNYKTVTLSTLAETFHFSEVYMSKLFIKRLGKNFSTVLRDIKMDKAKHYLKNTSLKIYEISEKLGYSSVDHFSRAFKSKFGTPPKKYQLENINLKK